MTYLICRIKVVEYFAWKRVFDSHAEAHRQSGLHLQKTLRNLDHPNEVFTLFEVTDIEKARSFVTSSDVPKSKEQSGVLDEPSIYFLQDRTVSPIPE